jgi:putative membrane protein
MALYQTLKAVHFIFVVSWFAGLFYIFRLFVYHVQYTMPMPGELMRI